MTHFKNQSPQDIVSRLIILEYLKEIGAPETYSDANEDQKRAFYYKFTDEEGNVQIDYNWEYALFKATMPQLEYFAKNYVDKMLIIDKKREAFHRQKLHNAAQEDMPSINIMDMAAADIARTKAEMIANGDK